jgi:hypothetical protein
MIGFGKAPSRVLKYRQQFYLILKQFDGLQSDWKRWRMARVNMEVVYYAQSVCNGAYMTASDFILVSIMLKF